MRMIDEFGKFMSLVAGLKNDGKYDDALIKVSDVFEGMLQLDSKFLKSVSSDELLNYLMHDLKYSDQYLKMVSDLLYEEGMIYHESGDPISARNVLEKTRILINHLMDSGSTFSFDWYEKLSVIDEILN